VAIRLNGVNQRINLGALNSTTQNRSFLAASIWIRPNPVLSSSPLFYFSRNGGVATPRFLCDLRNPSGGQAVLRIRARVPDTGSTFSLQSPNVTAQSGVWQHVVAQIDCNGKSAQIYSNGILDFEGVMPFTASATTNTPSDVAYLGGEDATNIFFAGDIDDFRIYDRLLGPAEVATLYAARGHDGIKEGLLNRFSLNGINSSVVGDLPNLTNGRSASSENSPVFTSEILSLRRKNLQGR